MKLRQFISALLLVFAIGLNAQNAPKYVFVFIGDGMGINPVMTAQSYMRTVHHSDSLLTMMQFPVATMSMTYSADAPITDSAAAGTAISTGFKTNNGMVGVTPDSVPVPSVAKQFKEMGYGVGIITSVSMDDATPSAFYANVPKRNMFFDIVSQAVESDYEFFGGARFVAFEENEDEAATLKKAFTDKGVQLIFGKDNLDKIESRRVVVANDPEIMTGSNIGYAIDYREEFLTLPLLTQTGLDHLLRVSPDKFFMMVEGGNIDRALHGNDAGTAIKEILKFDEAIRIAYDFYLQHPDETLIVVTADHDTGGLSHVHSKSRFPNSLRAIELQKASKEEFSDYCKAMLKSRRIYRWEDMQLHLEESFGLFTEIPVSDENKQLLQEKFEKTFNMRNSADQKTLYASFNEFAVEVFNLINRAAGTIFTTTGHSGNPVPVFAVGVGSDNFKSMQNNIDIPVNIRKAAGIE